MGTVKVRFSEKNRFGVLDHEVTLGSGIKFHNPMRIFPNGDGSEVTMTLTAKRTCRIKSLPTMPNLSKGI
jgi:hypothetical protein